MLRKIAVVIAGTVLLSGVAAGAPIDEAIPDHMTGELRTRNLPGGPADARGATGGSVAGYEAIPDHMTGELRTRNLPGGLADARGATGRSGWFADQSRSPFPRRGGLD